MRNETERVTRLVDFSKQYLKALKRLNVLLAKSSVDVTNRARARMRDDRQSTGELIQRLEHEIHCLCVEQGLAKREDYRYGDIEIGAAIGELYGTIKQHRREPEIN